MFSSNFTLYHCCSAARWCFFFSVRFVYILLMLLSLSLSSKCGNLAIVFVFDVITLYTVECDKYNNNNISCHFIRFAFEWSFGRKQMAKIKNNAHNKQIEAMQRDTRAQYCQLHPAIICCWKIFIELATQPNSFGKFVAIMSSRELKAIKIGIQWHGLKHWDFGGSTDKGNNERSIKSTRNLFLHFTEIQTNNFRNQVMICYNISCCNRLVWLGQKRRARYQQCRWVPYRSCLKKQTIFFWHCQFIEVKSARNFKYQALQWASK